MIVLRRAEKRKEEILTRLRIDSRAGGLTDFLTVAHFLPYYRSVWSSILLSWGRRGR